MPMNNRLLVPQKLPLLLDYAGGAAAAYSLRSLSNSYTGPVVTVRRSTDSAERDFTATEVSDGTLAAWCGGGDGYVKTWWDQSGKQNDMTAPSAEQPQLISSGVITSQGGINGLLFSAGKRLQAVAGSDFAYGTGRFFLSAVAYSNAPTERYQHIWGQTASGHNYFVFYYKPVLTTDTKVNFTAAASGGGSGSEVVTTPDGTVFANEWFTASVYRNSEALVSAIINGAPLASATNALNLTNTTYKPTIGGISHATVNNFRGYIAEVVLYSDIESQLLADRITADQMWYF